MTIHSPTAAILERWDQFNSASPTGSIFTSSLWLRAFMTQAQRSMRLVVDSRDGEWRSGLPVLVRSKGLYRSAVPPDATPYFGIVVTPEIAQPNVDAAVAESLALLTPEMMHIANYVEIPLLPGLSVQRVQTWGSERRRTYWAATSGVDEGSFPKEVRYEIRKARNLNLELEASQDIDLFYETLVLMCNGKGIGPPLPRRMLTAILKDGLSKSIASIYLVRCKTDVAAGAVILKDRWRSYYWLAATNPKYRSTGASYMLLAGILEQLAGTSKVLDLVGANVPSVARFKAHFAAKEVDYSVLKGFSSRWSSMTRKTYQQIRRRLTA